MSHKNIRILLWIGPRVYRKCAFSLVRLRILWTVNGQGGCFRPAQVSVGRLFISKSQLLLITLSEGGFYSLWTDATAALRPSVLRKDLVWFIVSCWSPSPGTEILTTQEAYKCAFHSLQTPKNLTASIGCSKPTQTRTSTQRFRSSEIMTRGKLDPTRPF